MQRKRLLILSLLLAAPALAACVVRQEVPPPAPVYSQASPYAASPYATQPYATQPGPAAAYQPADPYCAEAVGVAQDAAAQAAATGSGLDARRANRTAGYARRDC